MKQLINFLKNHFHYFFLLLIALTPILWFWGKGSNILINGVDTNFPLDPISWFLRRFYVWDNLANAGRDFSSSTAGIFFHLTQVIPYILGANLHITQIISLVFWFSLIIVGSFIFARIIFPKKFLIQVLFIVLYSFNIYLFNTWENVKVANLALIAAIPLVLSNLVLLQEEKIKKNRAFFYSVLIGIVVSGTGINPSYFICFFIILFIFSISFLLSNFKKGKVLKIFKDFVLVVIPIFLINFFWILPTTSFVINNVGPQGSIDKIGFTNWVDSLSKNTSIFNVMRIQGAWDWYAFDGSTGAPLYIPYALNYFYRLPFLVFSILLPALAILSLLLYKRKNYLYTAFGLMFILGVFLGAGTHLPTGNYFRWLANHLPFFTLFRSPWYIFTPLVILSLAGLIGLLFYNLTAKLNKFGGKFGKALIPTLVIVLAVGNLFYSYPLLSGKIFRPGKSNGFYINFPPYVFDAQKWLNSQKDGRVLTYPDDEIEQFRWGYRGIESILQLIADKEVLFAPLNAPDFPVAKLIKELYRNLKLGEFDAFFSLAARLDVNLLFEKKDQNTLSSFLPARITDLQKQSFGEWNFYQIPQDGSLHRIYTPANMLFGYPYSLEHRLQGMLPISSLLVNPDDSIVKSIPSIADFAGTVILAENSQEKDHAHFSTEPPILANRLVKRDMSMVEFNFNVPVAGLYQPTLERYHIEDFGIDLTRGIEVEVDAKIETWTQAHESDSYVFFQPIWFTEGKHHIILHLNSKNLIHGGDFESDELYFTGSGKGIFDVVASQQGRYLSILNKGEGTPEPSADFKILPFDPQALYIVQFKYKQIYGNNAQVIVLQGINDNLVKAQTETLPNYPEWNTFSFYYEPVKTKSVAKVALVAPYISDPLGTKILYDDLTVNKVFSNRLFFVKASDGQFLTSPKIDFTKLSPVEYTLMVNQAEGPHIILFSENYSPEWEMKLQDLKGTSLSIKPLHFSANGYANAWFVQGSPEQYKAMIYYKPQRLFLFGLVVAFATLLGSGLLFFYSKWQEKTSQK